MDLVNRLSIAFVLGFGVSIMAIAYNITSIIFQEISTPIKNKLNLYSILISNVLMLVASALQYNYILYVNQLSFFIVDPKYVSQSILIFIFIFHITTLIFINESITVNKINIFLFVCLFLSFFILDRKIFFIVFIIIDSTLLLCNLVIAYIRRKSGVLIILLLNNLAYIVLLILKFGYIFGFYFGSFYYSHLLALNKEIILISESLLFSFIVIITNSILLNIFIRNPDMDSRRNIMKLNKIKLKENRL